MCRGKLAKSMDLLCSETVSEGSAGQIRQPANQPATQAIEDPVLMQQRVLDNLLRKEERHPTPCTYFGTVQREITPHMRRVVAEWMLEVCDEQDCQEEVFPLAMTYLDRFLGTCTIGKNQLQLLGTACLLVASKLREPTSRGLPAEMLVFYTDNSITLDNLCKWELLLLSKLKWNMSAVTPHDFLQLLVSRLPLRGLVDVEMVTRHAQTFIALAARDYEFTMYTASTLAAASVAAALQGLDWPARANVNPCDLLERLHSLTGVEQDYLQTCLEQIEAMVQKTIQETSNNNPNGQAAPQMACADWPLPQNADKCHDKAGTPTDVRDVHF